MKKVGMLAGILFVSAIALMGCSSSSGNSGKVEDVSVDDVIAEAEAEGIVLNYNAKAVDNKNTFENNIMPEIISCLKNNGLTSGVTSLRQINSSSSLSAARAAVSNSDIEKAIKDLEQQLDEFKVEVKKLERLGECDASIDWEMPSGQYKVNNGINLDIDDFSFETNISGTFSENTKEFDLNGDFEVNADVTGKANLQKALGINVVPYAKEACKSNIDVDGFIRNNSRNADFKIDTDIYYGYSGAVIFNLSGYAGVVKLDVEISADAAIDEDFIQKYSSLTSGSFNQNMLTEEFFNDLPIEGSIYISVYDLKGNKKFSYIEAESLWEVYSQLVTFIK